MELKNALVVCLISLFSATIVLLIARTLDLQAASKLEPQLSRIVEELEALRTQGGIASAATASGSSASSAEASDTLVVYYFHSNTRCPTCRSIESQAYDLVHSEFSAELESGDLAWKVLNYEQPAVAELAAKFEIQMPVVVLAKFEGGEIVQWSRLDRIWALVGDKPGYASYVRDELQQLLGASEPQSSPAPAAEQPASEPLDADATDAAADALPVPADLPIPE